MNIDALGIHIRLMCIRTEPLYLAGINQVLK